MPLEEDNAQLHAENTLLKAQIAELVAEVRALKAQLALDSQNSSRPPSSDLPPPQTPSRYQRSTRGKKRGGKLGHRGTSLQQVATPDIVVVHAPLMGGGAAKTCVMRGLSQHTAAKSLTCQRCGCG